MKDIFITRTFRNDWNREFNLKPCETLEQKGFTVHLPQRDSEQSGDKKKIFIEDVAGVDNAKMLLPIGSKTQTSNWGFEIGYAYKSGKPILALTDEEHPLNLMTSGAVNKIITVKNLDNTESHCVELLKEIDSLLN